jgi:glucose-1-phosphatase
MKGIKNIIFDLGGVIFHIEYERTVKAFKELGIENIRNLYSQLEQHHLFDQLETGKITRKQFVEKLKKYCKKEVSEEQIIAAWNALLIDLPAENLDLLKELKNHYRLFLLSNTNEIHLHALQMIINEAHGIENLSDFFEKDYYSHLIGYRKPEEMAFRHILEEHELKPEETLFIDDSPQHLVTAKEMGINTLLKPPQQPLKDFLAEKGIF